jgi:HEAT repeat protein
MAANHQFLSNWLKRPTSGLFQIRCRAVQALGGLGAHDILKEYLELASAGTADPVEQLGNEAVVNAAAMVLSKHPDEGVFRLLLRLGARFYLTGVIAALATFQRREAVPTLIKALEDDGSRHVAENALKHLRPLPYQALVDAARMRLPDSLQESETSIRKRRSALGLLREIGFLKARWPQIRELINDRDPRVAVLACRVACGVAQIPERRRSIIRLVDLLNDSDWMLCNEIEECLCDNFNVSSEVISRRLSSESSRLRTLSEGASRILERIQRRMSAHDNDSKTEISSWVLEGPDASG